jgi:hypothetical protein
MGTPLWMGSILVIDRESDNSGLVVDAIVAARSVSGT